MTKERMDFDTAFSEVSLEVNKILFSAPKIVRTYTAHLSNAQGKFIRTHALLACAMDTEDLVSLDAVKLAAAIEILHLATLVHDDIMDNAKLRRGIETLNEKYGRKTAVICGDYLLSAALKAAAKVTVKEEYKKISVPNYVEQICMGEMRQYLNQGNLELSIYRYLSIINGKTAALFEAAFYAGAVVAKIDEEKQLRDYKRLGRYAGIVFQLTDDCIDFEEDETTAQKNVQSDYEQGVITLPLIYSLKNDSDLKKLASQDALDRGILSHFVVKAGGITFTKGVGRRYYQKAAKILDKMVISKEKEKKLEIILSKAYHGLKKKT